MSLSVSVRVIVRLTVSDLDGDGDGDGTLSTVQDGHRTQVNRLDRVVGMY